ncbi:hypothetical protein BgiMline_010310, partial [Biomphalaria glabrata]
PIKARSLQQNILFHKTSQRDQVQLHSVGRFAAPSFCHSDQVIFATKTVPLQEM